VATKRQKSSNSVAPKPPRPSGMRPKARTCRIVVVDDNLDLQELLAMAFESWGHSVQCASHGVTGLELILQLRPDIAVLDIGLPGIDGYHIARLIRTHTDKSAMLLIALTGDGTREHQQAAITAGFDYVLVKPFDPNTLRILLAGGEPTHELAVQYRRRK
jgi:DNA-binding response OmpR family regulator